MQNFKLYSEEVAMHLAFTNSIKQTAIDNEEIAYFLLKYLIENYREKIEERYNIQIVNKNEIESEDVLEVRENIARKKGCILSGGRIDERKVSDMILRDFQDGKLGRISLEKPDDIINN